MNRFAPKTSKKQQAYKTPYVTYWPHSKPVEDRKWDPSYYQVVSIDPALVNYAIRIERRYMDGRIIPIVFYKGVVHSDQETDNNTIVYTYRKLSEFLDKYKQFYFDCHYIIIEKQMPQNFQVVTIEHYTIAYFSNLLFDSPLLPSIISVDPKLKGKMLGVPKGLTYTQLKAWSVQKAHELLKARGDTYSLGVLQEFKKKMDDLSDVVIQIEAVFLSWGLPGTQIQKPPELVVTNVPSTSQILQLAPIRPPVPNTLTLTIIPKP